jgi:LmbE family N-acetylglucosaminyl deacetylase
MSSFVSDLKQYWKDRPFIWSEGEDVSATKVRLPESGRVLVLGPHPDDPESVAITCRLLMQSGCDIWYAIATLSPSGVEDEYFRKRESKDSNSLKERKCKVREAEQIRATEIFGLTPNRVTFLGIDEEEGFDCPGNLTRIKDQLESVKPDIAILPAGKDTNLTHAWVHQAFRKWARDQAVATNKTLVALYNEDPKTIEMRKDLFVLFGEEGADWKRSLLRTHDSQQQRNIHRRGMGFDERILRMNSLNWKHLVEISASVGLSSNYAEVFEIELFDQVENLK